jgi:hypothetical protein
MCSRGDLIVLLIQPTNDSMLRASDGDPYLRKIILSRVSRDNKWKTWSPCLPSGMKSFHIKSMRELPETERSPPFAPSTEECSSLTIDREAAKIASGTGSR